MDCKELKAALDEKIFLTEYVNDKILSSQDMYKLMAYRVVLKHLRYNNLRCIDLVKGVCPGCYSIYGSMKPGDGLFEIEFEKISEFLKDVARSQSFPNAGIDMTVSVEKRSNGDVFRKYVHIDGIHVVFEEKVDFEKVKSQTLREMIAIVIFSSTNRMI